MTWETDGWIIVKGFLPKEYLTKTFSECVKEVEHLPTDRDIDTQCTLSPSFYNSKYMAKLLVNYLHKMEKKTGLKLYKTYSYWRWYMEGEILLPHTDRPSCEISATIFIGGGSWDIYIKSYDGTIHKVTQEPGDALIYRGCDLRHWREEFVGSTHAQVFIHYVDQNGPNKKHKDDAKQKTPPKIYSKIV